MVPPFNWERSRDGKIAPCQQLHRRSIKAATFTTRRFPSKVQARRAVCTCMLPLTGGIPSYWKHQRARELWQTTLKFLNDSRFWQWITWPQVSAEAILAQAEVRIAFTFRCSDRTEMPGCREICLSERNTSNSDLTQTGSSRHISPEPQAAGTPSRLCQVLCPPKRQMGTFEYSQPHATIT